jgi:hypothetical protein
VNDTYVGGVPIIYKVIYAEGYIEEEKTNVPVYTRYLHNKEAGFVSEYCLDLE